MAVIRVGNAPCSWGTLEFNNAETGRVECDTMLDELVASGYTGSELGDGGFMPTEPDALAQKFADRGLSLTGAFVPVALRDPNALAPGLKTCLDTASLLRQTSDILADGVEPFLVLADDNGSDDARTRSAGRVDESSMGLSADEWQTFAAGANRIARAVSEDTGLSTVFHHHCAGFVETPREIDRLLENTDEKVLGLVFDTGHYVYGAGYCHSVVAAMDRYASRIWYVHLKDVHPDVASRARAQEWDYFEAIRNGIFCELGDGCVDFRAVVDWLTAHGYSGYVTVEQDILPGMGTPLESAQRDREYLRSIGL